MSTRKERLTVTVDPSYVDAGNSAVAEGRAESVNAWVNTALAEKIGRERRLAAMAEAVVAYESKHGVISVQELADRAMWRKLKAAQLRRHIELLRV